MSKRYGPRYDPALRKSEHGSKIYGAWRRVRKYQHYEGWDCYPPFYDWCMKNGYFIGARLYLIDPKKPYSPENCVWLNQLDEYCVPVSWINNWNKTVNRIRKYYGMPPLEGTKYED